MKLINDTNLNKITKKSVFFRPRIAEPKNNKIRLDIDWGWDLFKPDISNYDNRLAIAGLILSGASLVSKIRVAETLRTLGFTDIKHYYYDKDNIDHVAHSIAAKQIRFGDEIYNLFTVVCRGTTTITDIITDVKCVSDGFQPSARHILENLKSFMLNLKSKMLNESQFANNLFFFTGHSLGGAVTLQLSLYVDADQEISFKNKFVYTYASPKICMDQVYKPNVFNIVNEIDIVTNLPPTYNARIGVDIKFRLDNSQSQTIYEIFRTLTSGRDLKKLMDLSSDVFIAVYSPVVFLLNAAHENIIKYLFFHTAETYLSYLLSREDAEPISKYNIKIMKKFS